MKVAIFAIIACALIATVLAKDCANTAAACKGPVREVYTNADCSGDPETLVQLQNNDYEGGKCIKTFPDATTKYSGSSKGSCGTKLSGKSYIVNDCSGPYSYGSTPVNKCFKIEGAATATSYKIQCASASTATFSAALVALLAFVALLF
jgi:hypothetical protein